MNHDESFNCYAGVACAALSVYAMLFVWKRRALLAKLVPVLVALVATGTPVAWIHYVVTGSASLYLPDTVCLVPVCLGLLMGYAGDELGGPEPRRVRMLVALGVLAGACLLPLGYFYLRARDVAPAINVRLMEGSLGYGVLFLALSTAVLGRFGPFRRPALMKLGLAVLLTLDLVLMGIVEANGLERPFLAPAPLYRRDATVEELERCFHRDRGVFRCCDYRFAPNNEMRSRGLGSNYGNRGLVFGYYDSGGYDSLPPGRIAQLLRYPDVDFERTDVRNLFATKDRALRLTSSKYVALPEGVQLLTDCLPRVCLFSRFHVERDPTSALERLFDTGFDCRAAVVLADRPDMDLDDRAPEGKVAIEREGLNSVDIRVRSERNCLLLMNDTYDPGWTATVDGAPAEVLRANVAFRAIAVPAGEHLVCMRFAHEGLRAGTYLAGAGLLLLAGLGVAGVVSRRCDASPSHLVTEPSTPRPGLGAHDV
jgi:hypothetical protein